MRRFLLSAVAAAAIAAGFSADARAQCYWTGYAWSCGYGGAYREAQPYGWYGGSGDRSAFGYEPRGLPHRFGPEPGGGFYHEGQYGIGHSD